MAAIQERYNAIPMAVDSAVSPGSFIAGFLAWTSGTLTLTSATGQTLIDEVPVTAGVYLPLPFSTGGPTAVVTLAGGASGTLAV